jgi:hypothetical protein
MKPRVFVSGVVHGLKDYRERVRRIIEQEFGWEYVGSESFWGPALSACLTAVGHSDLYIGLFGRRAGSPVEPHELPMSELEYYSAVNARIPVRVFVIRCAFPEGRLDAFLTFLREEKELGQFLEVCNDRSDLEQKIRKDLAYFGELRNQGMTARMVPPLILADMLAAIERRPGDPFMGAIPGAEVPQRAVCTISLDSQMDEMRELLRGIPHIGTVGSDVHGIRASRERPRKPESSHGGG